MNIDYVNQIKLLNQKNIDTYINEYSNLFEFPLYSLNETSTLLKNNSDDLFPERKIVVELMNHGNHLRLLMSLFKYWNELDLTWLYVNLETHHINLADALNESSPFFIFHHVGFNPEILLSHHTRENTLSFLFLYFLPHVSKNHLLFYYSNYPLITSPIITIEYFELILYLMNEFTFHGKNLNHLLIDYFLDSQLDLLNKDTDFSQILPFDRIHHLLELNHDFHSYFLHIKKEYNLSYPHLLDYLIQIQYAYFFNKMDKQIINDKENILSKI